jgi:ABC-type molybdate transport system ATPase subunit
MRAWPDSAAGIDVPTTKRRVGYVFQDARLFPHLRVAANLDLEHVQRRAKGRLEEEVEDVGALRLRFGRELEVFDSRDSLVLTLGRSSAQGIETTR